MKVGDYVRTKDGYIDRIKKIDVEDHERENDEGLKPYEIYELKNEYFDEEYNETSCWVFEDFIKKSSPNIIDLIEVGDYVNGSKVMNIVEEDNINYLILDRDEVFYDDYIEISSDLDIKSIVTKEQFESMEYKVKE